MDYIDLLTCFSELCVVKLIISYEVIMVTKCLIEPEHRRVLSPPFAWIDRRFFFSGFLQQLSAAENLLYFFLVLVSDKDGLSYYSYDKICGRLKFTLGEFISARDSLIGKHLIAHKDGMYQVLRLPISKNTVHSGRSSDADVCSG